MTDGLSAPVAVVTGASSGIGRAIVNSLNARGFFVVATMRRPEAAPPEFLSMKSVVVRPLDVTSDTSVAEFAAWLRDNNHVNRLDVVVNNAGYGAPGTVETVSIDAAKNVFDVNVWGVARMCKATLPVMRESGRGGLIVVVSSTSGVRGIPCSDIYAASKFAVEGMMESLRYSVAPDNIKVCLANPGPVDTGFIGRYHREKPRPDGEGPELAHKMTAKGLKVLEGRLANGQTAESCGDFIADIVESNYALRISEPGSKAHFWNGTSEEARHICSAVKSDVTGYTSEIYKNAWNLAFDLAKRARGEEG